MRAASIGMPWRDRAGRLSGWRVLALALVLAPGLPLAFDTMAGTLGAEPLKAATQRSGALALYLLVGTLAVTPFGRIARQGRVLDTRRIMGVGSFAWLALHALLYAADQGWVLPRITTELLSRFYLTIGAIAWLTLAALAVTSTDGWMRRLKRGWKRLHWLVFPALLLGLWHAALQGKANASTALAMAGVTLFLLAWRWLPRPGLAALFGLGLLAALLTIGMEYLWYANATRLPAARIMAANWDPALAPRPAAQVLLLAWGGLALAWLVRPRRPA